MSFEVETHFEIEYTVQAREGYEAERIPGKARFPDMDALRIFLLTARKDMQITAAYFVRTSKKDILSCQDMLQYLKNSG